MKLSTRVGRHLAMMSMMVLGLLSMPTQAANTDAIAERLKPVGELCLQGMDCGGAAPVAAASSGSLSGEEVYNQVCMACHATGAAGAPKRGDTAAWAPRLEKGMETLHNHALNGFNAMPAKGGRPDLSDEEVMAAVDYIIEGSR